MPPSKTTAKNTTNKKTKAPPKKVVTTPPKAKAKAKVETAPVDTPPVAQVAQVAPVDQVAPVAPVAPVAEVLGSATETVVSDTPYAEEFSAIVSELDAALTTVRALKTRLQKLEKTVHKDHKVMAKKIQGRGSRKTRDPNAPKSGFARPGPVSDEMRKFLSLTKEDTISRTDVTKRIHEYCKSKDLQNPADKRQINADATLRKLLKMSKTDDLTFFNLQKYMKVHFPNKEGVYPTA